MTRSRQDTEGSSPALNAWFAGTVPIKGIDVSGRLQGREAHICSAGVRQPHYSFRLDTSIALLRDFRWIMRSRLAISSPILVSNHLFN